MIEAINPRTGVVDFRSEAADSNSVRSISERLRRAQLQWSGDTEKRISVLQAWADSLEARGPQLAEALTADTGRRLLSHFEVTGMAQRIRYWIQRFPGLLAPGEELRSRSAANVTYQHQKIPYALVGIISPWNFPLTLSLVDTIPALCAGCAALIKPSEVTPRFAAVLNETIQDVPGLSEVLGIVLGDGETGSALIDNVDMICFTGSVTTGRKVAVQAAQNFIPACLELGGKDPAIVLADADIKAAADALMRSAAGSCGQACMSIERIYVDQRVFEKLRDQLVEIASTLSYNTPDIHRGALYPFIDQRQALKVREQLENALEHGARLHCGGAPELIDGGYWMRPTVLSDISDEMLLMREETFGPLLPLIPFDTDQEAVMMANSGDFGLSGSVFGEREHALRIARELRVGAVGINDASMTALIHDIEKQSFGFSGLGPSRMGDQGLLRFLRTKALMIQHDQPAPAAALDEAGLPA
ncbi:lactaldehyde dehydrogenase [gamma proteobacterium NOR5-3]|nr:lactaldehyde dehydrogenase [gamma proteobacterium NOR5-3]